MRGDLNESGRCLHRRLLDGDICVTAEIAELFLPKLLKALNTRFFNFPDPQLIETVAEDVLLSYLKQPEQFNPEKSSLIAYLYMCAHGDVLNLIQKHNRLVELFQPLSEYELETIVAHSDPETLLIEEEARSIEAASPIMQMLFSKVTDETDREMIELMMDGVRDTEAYARVLGIEEFSNEEQKAIVKRHKDRLKKSLQRVILRSNLTRV